MRSASNPAIVVITAMALSLLPAAAGAESVSGYWRQQGETTFHCSGWKTLADCRDITVTGTRFEMLDWVPGHATFRVSGTVGGGFNTMTWRADWSVPPYVIPGQIIQVTNRGTVIGVSYGTPQFPFSYYVPNSAWNGWGSVDWPVAEWGGKNATAAGQSSSVTNTTIRAKAPPPGGLAAGTKAHLDVSQMSVLQASIPYVWVKGTPPRVTPAPTKPTATATAHSIVSSRATTAPKIVPPPVTTRVFFNNNIAGVSNGGKSPTVTFDSAVKITYILTYHYNGGRGAPAGTIALRRSDGTVYGPWQAILTAGVYWEVAPNVVLPAGRYQLIDSDPATWAQNGESGGFGMSDIRGDRQ